MLSYRATSFLPALAAAAITLTPVLAPAATPGMPAIRVTTSDLNLATQAGVATLYGRIRAAAQSSCEPLRQPTTGSRIPRGYDACVSTAVTDTVQKLAIPGLSALHAARGAAASPS